jgi:hypothetical protein
MPGATWDVPRSDNLLGQTKCVETATEVAALDALDKLRAISAV